MHKIILSLVLIIYFDSLIAQKPLIDSNVFDRWSSLESGLSISNDGNYVSYGIRNQPENGRTLVFQSTQSEWKKEFVNAAYYGITNDGRIAVFKSQDSLGILMLGSEKPWYILGIASVQVSKNGLGNWIGYTLKDSGQNLHVLNLVTRTEKIFPSVLEYSFNNDATVLLLLTQEMEANKIKRILYWLSLTDFSIHKICQDKKASNYVFDRSNHVLAFTVDNEVDSETETSVWLYKKGDEGASMLINNKDVFPAGMSLDPAGNHFYGTPILRFSNDENRLFFTLKSNFKKKEGSQYGVDIWSYTDVKLQSEQLAELNSQAAYPGPDVYTGVIKLKDRKIFYIDEENEKIINYYYSDAENDEVLLISKTSGDPSSEGHWNPKAKYSVYLVSAENGKRSLIKDNIVGDGVLESYRLSPSGKYVVYFDPKTLSYFSYDVRSGSVKNITDGIHATWITSKENDWPDSVYKPIGIAGFMGEDEDVVIYDQKDIYRVKIIGNSNPIDLTNGFGNKNNITFRLALDSYTGSISPDEKLILSAFNRTNKQDGFYSVIPGYKKDPERLVMKSEVFKGPDESEFGDQFSPTKAKNRNIYLLRRMSSFEAPNLVVTGDFKEFRQITDIHPEKAYNWMRAELINWKMFDGTVSQGILYKPENFDSTKRYPMILFYYERVSETLNRFIYPDASAGALNIPYYVSNGYLVFIPDISYKIGLPGESAYNSIVSAADYLTHMKWVDGKKMGIQGHSRGGYETNYIVTHTDKFAAAMSASGMSDYISLYGGIRKSGSSRQSALESGSQRIGATIWERPDLYIKNSPVFNADRVTTPLLMMSNKADSDIPFEQGVELFTELRRLGKKVWMLQYDGADHVVFGWDALDLTIRMKQFFDHYLLGAPPPKWMTDGIPAKMKGIELGYELGTRSKVP